MLSLGPTMSELTKLRESANCVWGVKPLTSSDNAQRGKSDGSVLY